jgi:hypothetical protein
MPDSKEMQELRDEAHEKGWEPDAGFKNIFSPDRKEQSEDDQQSD